MTASLAGLVAPDRRSRSRAIRELAPSTELAFALRRVLFKDADYDVISTAARRLGELEATSETWLLDALGDRSPLVRDTLLRALAKIGSVVAIAPVRALVRTERLWWVRRTAVYTLAALARETEVTTFTAVLADPFWRVRHAAVRVLAVLGAGDLDIREQVIAAPPSTTVQFLRAAWGPVAVEAPAPATTASLLPPALLDPDPAVVTARLAEMTVPALALVELLCDPHAPLRLLAAERVAASGDAAAHRAALDWLEEPRIPHVAETVEHILDGLGDPALALAEHVLATAGRPGAARWAIAWVVATRSETLHDAVLARAHADPSLRRAALPLASDAELVAWADAGDVRDAIAIELHARRSDALFTLAAASHPAIRALQIDAAARRDQWSIVEAALVDPHHGPRAVATRWLVRARRIDGTAQLLDGDPAVREAALSSDHAAPLVADPDPFVARAALEHVVQRWHTAVELPPEIARVAELALGAADPWLRATACRLPIANDRALASIVELLSDDTEMVRSAALEAFEQVPVARLAALGELSDRARRLVDIWLERPVADRAIYISATPERPRVAKTPASVERRPFGRAGFSVAPLAISGAFDPPPDALAAAADAGVDLWFWEPAYEHLSNFLRTRRDHVIAGTYHADARSIEADVDRALRRLRRDSLDVFLLFWSRSPARVDAAAFAMVERLKRAGKIRAIGFSTHHRELARTAIQTSPWDVVMIRHSAAHPGIETELLPTARELDTAILTFSALCYGRMVSGPNAPSPADCYRYSLSQPGVTAVISAPRRFHEIVENVDVLRAPTLAAERLAALREHGIGVRAENQRFNTLLRQPTRDAAAAARELLATELPPADELEQRPLPRPSSARPARTQLGKTRRGR